MLFTSAPQRLTLNSVALSRYSFLGLPLIGHCASTPSVSNQGRLSPPAWAKHNPTETADGGSNVTTMPTRQRLNASIATVKYGRPIGLRSRSSTTIRSMTV